MSFNRKFVLKHGSYSTLELLTNQGLGLVSFFILVRMQSKTDFGIWVLFMSTTTLLEQARLGFIKNGFIQYLIDVDEDKRKTVFGSSLILNLIFFAFTAILCLVFSFYVGPVLWKEDVLTDMFLLYIPMSFLLTFYLQFKMVEQAELDFRASFLMALARRLLFIVILLVFAVSKYEFGLSELVVYQGISLLVGAFVGYILVRKKIIISLDFDFKFIRKLAAFGVYTLGTNISAMILRNIDQFMLGSFSNKIFLAYYNAAVRITNLIEIPTNAMSSIVYPKSVQLKRLDRSDEMKQVYENSVAAIFVLVLPIVILVLLFPEFFLLIIAGKEYLDATEFLRVTILFALFVPFMRQGGTILDSLGKPRINFYLTFFAAIVNVISNLLFIKFFGPIGAAYGTLVSYFVIIVVNQYFITRILHSNIFQIFLNIPVFYYKLIVAGVDLIKKRK